MGLFIMNDIAKIDEEFGRIIDTSLWWQEVMKECLRRREVSQANVPVEHKVIAVQMLIEATSITDEQLAKARTSPAFIEARNIIGGLNSGDIFPERLVEIFLERKAFAIQELDQLLRMLASLISDSSCKTEVENVLSGNKSTKRLSPHIIEEYGIKDLIQKRVIFSIIELCDEKDLVHCSDRPFHFEIYTHGRIGDREKEINSADLLAYCVHDPLWNMERIKYDPVSLSFPLRWASELPVTTIRKLFEQHKEGKDVLLGLVGHYKDEEALVKLTDAIRYCPVVCHHYFLFEEAVQAFKSGLFRICSVTLLSLIEGMIWSFAWWWNERKGPIFDRSLSQESYKNAKFSLMTKNFKTINKPNVGNLLRNTIFGDEVYDEFVEFYCEELFSERNPVLHGKEPKYGTPKKAATLLYVIQIVMRHITKAFVDDLYNNHLAFTEGERPA
ncbi:MAG: hypothetical protein L0220_15895 [Acidobacteria bacterium]|nr:hypothetical protein [Acidobacteriota bacterium]